MTWYVERPTKTAGRPGWRACAGRDAPARVQYGDLSDWISSISDIASDPEGAGKAMMSDAGKAAVEGAAPIILARLKADLPNITQQVLVRVRPALEAEVAAALRSGTAAATAVKARAAKRTAIIGGIMVVGIFAAAYIALG